MHGFPLPQPGFVRVMSNWEEAANTEDLKEPPLKVIHVTRRVGILNVIAFTSALLCVLQFYHNKAVCPCGVFFLLQDKTPQFLLAMLLLLRTKCTKRPVFQQTQYP